jgi:hypothetical protein
MGGMAASRVRTRAQRPEQPVLKKRSRVPSRSGKDDEQDWAPEPIFKPVNVNGVPTFVRFSRRKGPGDQWQAFGLTNKTYNKVLSEPIDSLASNSGNMEMQTKIKDMESSSSNSSEAESQNLSEEESERRESIYEEPLLFSEDVVDVKIVSLDDR